VVVEKTQCKLETTSSFLQKHAQCLLLKKHNKRERELLATTYLSMLAQETKCKLELPEALGKFKKCKCNRLGTKLVQAQFGSTLDLSVKFPCRLEHFGLVFRQNTRFWIPIPLHFMDNFNIYQTLKEHVRFAFASGGGALPCKVVLGSNFQQYHQFKGGPDSMGAAAQWDLMGSFIEPPNWESKGEVLVTMLVLSSYKVSNFKIKFKGVQPH
jgi:hypothetical protein